MPDDLNKLRAQVKHLEEQISLMISLQISIYGAVTKMRHLPELPADLLAKLDKNIQDASDVLDKIIENISR